MLHPKSENRGRYAKMGGTALVPPLGDAERMAKLGPLLPTEVHVEGTTWKSSSTDLAIAGHPSCVLALPTTSLLDDPQVCCIVALMVQDLPLCCRR